MDKIKVLEEVLEQRNYMNSVKRPELGQFVMTGLQMPMNPMKMVGYCMQIRVGRGQFGSDMVFLRHADGSLTTHENQGYYKLSERQEKLARSVFETLPEDEIKENPELLYKCCGKIEEKGFLIENSKSQPYPDTSFGLIIKG